MVFTIVPILDYELKEIKRKGENSEEKRGIE